jgi:hypothetical protein
MENEVRKYGKQIYIGDAKLGYIYWQFLLGRSSINHFLSAAGCEADCGTGSIDCESVYGILNDLESNKFETHELIRRIENLFSPLLATSKYQWNQLGLTEPIC